MDRRPMSLSLLLIYLSMASLVMIFITIRMAFLNEDPLVTHSDDGQVAGSLPIFVGLGVSVINFICGINMLDGANWARWVYVIVAIGLFVFQYEFLLKFNYMVWLSISFRCVMILFLFLPASNDFFKSSKL